MCQKKEENPPFLSTFGYSLAPGWDWNRISEEEEEEEGDRTSPPFFLERRNWETDAPPAKGREIRQLVEKLQISKMKLEAHSNYLEGKDRTYLLIPVKP